MIFLIMLIFLGWSGARLKVSLQLYIFIRVNDAAFPCYLIWSGTCLVRYVGYSPRYRYSKIKLFGGHMHLDYLFPIKYIIYWSVNLFYDRKCLWRSVTSGKVAGFTLHFTKNNTPPWVFFTFFKLYKNGHKSLKASTNTIRMFRLFF